MPSVAQRQHLSRIFHISKLTRCRNLSCSTVAIIRELIDDDGMVGKCIYRLANALLPALAMAAVLLLGACGTSVPKIQEVYESDEQGKSLVQAILTNVTCEVQDAVISLYAHRQTTFMDSWGVQINLLLTIEEASTFAPSVNWLPNSIFNLGAGASATGDATRIDKIDSYFTIQELRNRRHKCVPQLRPGGTRLMAGDLKLTEWLADAVAAGETGEIKFQNSAAFKASGVLSHEVRFLVTTTGTVNPGWKLSRVVSVTPVVNLFSASRDRTHDLTITFGPTDATGVHPGPSAANASLSSEFGAQIFANIRNAMTGP